MIDRLNGEQNLRLVLEIEANRAFLLAAIGQNPVLLERAEARIKALFKPLTPADATVANEQA